MPVYKDEKRGSWYAAFYYIDWTGKKKHKVKRGFALEREAKQYEKDTLDMLHTKTDIEFSNLVENYMKDMQHRLKESTFSTKKYLIDLKIVPKFKRLKICDINTVTVRNWQNELIDYRDQSGKPYSQTYIKTINNQLSAIMNYAVKHYGLLQNPCHSAGSIGKSKAKEMNFWTRDEFTKAIFYEKKSGFRVAMDILYYSGIREGELFALTPADILPSKQLRINKTYSVLKRKVLVTDPKTPKSIRNVAIPDFLYNEVENYIGMLYGLKDDEQIFVFTKSSLCKEMKALSEKSGLKRIRVHDLRHSHAALCIHLGISIYDLSRRLGHESIKTTADTYGHLYNAEAGRDIANRLEIRNEKDLVREINSPSAEKVQKAFSMTS